jgi:hypothetical protein
MSGGVKNPPPSPALVCLLSPGADMVRENVGQATQFCLGPRCRRGLPRRGYTRWLSDAWLVGGQQHRSVVLTDLIAVRRPRSPMPCHRDLERHRPAQHRGTMVPRVAARPSGSLSYRRSLVAIGAARRGGFTPKTGPGDRRPWRPGCTQPGPQAAMAAPIRGTEFGLALVKPGGMA